MNSRFLKMSLVFLAAFLSSSCELLFPKKSLEKNKADPITIGWIGPLSGPVSLLGIDNLNAMNMAVEEINNSNMLPVPLVLVAEDDQYKTEVSISKYREIMAKHKPSVVFISTYTATFQLADFALKDEVVLINPIDNDGNLSRLNKNVFLIAKKTESLAKVITDHLSLQKFKNTSILYLKEDDFMPIVAGMIKSQLETEGVLVKTYPYDSSVKSFSSELKEMKAKKTDSLVMLGYKELATAMKEARSLGNTQPFYTANLMMQEEAREAIEGTRYFDFTWKDGNREEAKKFLAKYEATYQKMPVLQWTAFQAHDAVYMLAKALKSSLKQEGLLIDRIRKNLADLKNFGGLSGNISINADGSSSGISPGLYEFSKGEAIRLPDY